MSGHLLGHQRLLWSLAGHQVSLLATPVHSMSDDQEQTWQVEASPTPARPPAQTPLLSRFLGAGAPSPAISLRNLGRGVRGTPRTPYPVRFRVEEGGDAESSGRIEEEAAESAEEGLEP